MPPIIDGSKCDLCGTCISVCRCNALILTGELQIDNEKCSECGRCITICPAGALGQADHS